MNPHFASLVLGLAHQAESALEGNLPPGADSATGGTARTVAQALIDTLAMLEAKTRGQLEPAEAKLLGEALTALRFRFVQTGGGAGPGAGASSG
jgi:hypothetical protein